MAIPKSLYCLVLDRSASMNGKPIDELNTALKQFKTDIESDSILSNSVEIAIVTFDDKVEIIQNPSLIHNIVMPTLIANNLTSLNTVVKEAAVKEAIRIIEERKDYYKQTQQTYKRPWIVVMTNAVPTDIDIKYFLCKQIDDTQNKKYVLLPIEVDDEADIYESYGLVGYTNSYYELESTKPFHIESAEFSEFFPWLFKCMQIEGQIFNQQILRENEVIHIPPPDWLVGFTI